MNVDIQVVEEQELATVEEVDLEPDVEPPGVEAPPSISDDEWARRHAAHLRRRIELTKKIERTEQQLAKFIADLDEEDRIQEDLMQNRHRIGLLRFIN